MSSAEQDNVTSYNSISLHTDLGEMKTYFYTGTDFMMDLSLPAR